MLPAVHNWDLVIKSQSRLTLAKMWSLLRITLVLSLAIFHSGLVSGQPGSEWSDSDILIIKEKILYVIQNTGRAANEYKKRYPDRSYISQTIPNAAKVRFSNDFLNS